MATIRVKSQPDLEETELVNVYQLDKAEGWFVLKTIVIPKDLLDKQKVYHKTEPDIFPILIEHLIKAAKSEYGI